MRIITLNANGIRAAAGKGFFDWMHRQDADIVCIQETKAQHPQLGDRHFFPPGYHAWYHDALSKGYSGVAIYSRAQPDRVHYGLGWEVMDSEGRWLQADYGDLSVVSLYLPSGSSGTGLTSRWSILTSAEKFSIVRRPRGAMSPFAFWKMPYQIPIRTRRPMHLRSSWRRHRQEPGRTW